MLRVIGNDQNLPRQEHAIASDTITSGAPVVVNTDGTVGPSAGSVSFLEGTAVNFSSQFDGGVGYDSTNNKIVVAWADESNNAYGSARVGTIDPSDNSVTFGSTTVFESAGVKVKHGSIAHDVANNRIVIVYKDEGNSSYGTAVVGTISGTSISFGTPVVFQSSNTSDPDVTYSPTAEKVLVAYRNVGDTNKGKAVVGTVSGTSISFGSIAQFDTQVTNVTISYITTADKFCIYYKDIQASSKHTDAVIATISGTSVSFGSPNRISPNTATSSEIPSNGRAVYDTKNDKMIFTWSETGDGGHAVVGTVSGTSVSVGSEVIFSSEPIDSEMGVVFDENVGKVLIFYRETVGGTRVRKYIIGTVSGTSISFNTEASFGPNTNSTSKYTTVYDSGSKRVVIAYDDSSNSEIGYVTVFTVAGTAQNLTSENYIGIARSGAASGAGAIIDTQGAIADNLSGLTAGQSYYVQTDGTLGTTAASPSVFAGTAVSATKLIVKG
jgi:hypothetical protein